MAAAGDESFGDAIRRAPGARVIGLDVLAVAHELKTPIAAVRGAAEALRAEALETGARDRLLAVITRATDQLGRLADDLLAAARLDADELEVVLAPCDVAAVAREVVEAAQVAVPSACVRLQAAARLPRAAADGGRLGQVLANLVDNAVVHGGGTVVVALDEVEGRVSITVRDAGPGIPPEQRERIFLPFERRASDDVPGAGLGLHLARRLVAAMAGTLTASGAPGGGAIFTVSLPRA